MRLSSQRGGTRAMVAHAFVAFIAVAQLASPPARAALFDDDEARRRVEALRARVDQLENTISQRLGTVEDTVKGQGLLDLLRDVESIKADIAKLRGQYEVLTYELEQAQKRQRDLYLDLDSRMRKLESAPGGGAPAANAPAANAPPPAEGPPATNAGAAPVAAAPQAPLAAAANIVTEQRAYDAALDQFKSGNYAAAVTSFQAFARANSRSPLAPSALYWAGNAQFALKDYRAAIATQRQVVATYPDSQKVPDAMLNIASCYVELGDNAGSRRTLQDIVAKYPTSEAAGKARQRLGAR
jgi:tol-pal system protein YbgF